MMVDEIFGEVIFDNGYYCPKKEISMWGTTQEVEILIAVDEDEDKDKRIAPVQRDAYIALMENWEEVQSKIAAAILKFYNEEEKYSYGPEEYDEDEDDDYENDEDCEYDEEDDEEEWWPDIDDEEELIKRIHLDGIVIKEDYLMERIGINPIYILFNRDWGGDDPDDNGVAVLIENGDVKKVGYKDIAF